MDRLIYTAMSGARQSFDRQAVVSNNLANVSTAGFRAQLHATRAVPVRGDGELATRVAVASTTPGSRFAPGDINATGRDMDVALQGDAWLAVQDADGNEAYTRRGDLQVDASGMITSAGRPVVGENGPVVVPLGAQLSIGADGTISAIGVGNQPDSLVEVGRMKLVSRGDSRFLRGADGLFRAADADGAVAPLAQDEGARLQTGALEGSNVSAIESMVDMIASSRLYEMQMKVISSSDENARQADRLLAI